jgi:Predicted membrane protein
MKKSFSIRLSLSLLLSFIIPVICMIVVYRLIHIYPFGDKTIFTNDSIQQYSSFLSYLKEIYSGDADIFYTFSKNIGGDMISIFAYYLMSPLNFIVCFFSIENLSNAVLIITLIKIGLSGLTMNIFLLSKKKCYSTLIFSTSYALMAYNIVYQQNIMWLDGVLLLPIIILGLERILEHKSPFIYIIFLAGGLITNYYIGFMICIFVCIYFIYKTLVNLDRIDNIPFKNIFQNIINLFISSLLAGGLASIILVPTFKSLSGTKAHFSLQTLAFKENFKLLDLISKTYIGSSNQEQITSTGLPNIYSGLLILFLVFLFFLSKGIKLKEKLFSAFLLICLILSFYINSFNLIWHGFNPPVWFPFRYSFVFSFFCINIAYRAFSNIKEHMIYSYFIKVAMGFLGISIIANFYFNYDFLSSKKIFVSVVIVFLITLIFILMSKFERSFYTIGIFMLLCINCSDLILNGKLILGTLYYSYYDYYSSYTKEVSDIVNQVKAEDSSFYRYEGTFRRTNNDSMQFNFNGLTHYSSSEKTFVKEFDGKLGFRNNGIWAYYKEGSTIAADSLMSIKYVMSKNLKHNKYDALFNKYDITVYRNPYALPIGFMVNSDIKNIDMNKADLFEVQNDIFSKMTGNKFENFLDKLSISKVEVDNVTAVKTENGIKYKKIDPDNYGYVEYTISVKDNNPIYAYFPIGSSKMSSSEIYVNGESIGYYFDPLFYGIIPLGDYKKGDEVKVRIYVNANNLELSDALFYSENMEVLKQYCDNLNSNPYSIKEFSKSYFNGEVTSENKKDYLFLTIPKEDGWTIKVDGQKVESIMVLDALTAIHVPQGTHNLELKYVPPGLYLGIGLSLSSSISLVLYIILYKRLKFKNNV